jgi:hypothetical protein
MPTPAAIAAPATRFKYIPVPYLSFDFDNVWLPRDQALVLAVNLDVVCS